ncbi:MAG TPA: sialidase family protein [Candidatus Thermoplasmatota archaeon]|nr:sialidase family protein [Candidatus Thermoplasmatota archaeon]
MPRPARTLALPVALLVLAGCLGVEPSVTPPVVEAAAECLAPCAVVLAEHASRFWEPHVAVDPRDPDHVVAAVTVLGGPTGPDPFRNDLLVALSHDGGKTWSSSLIPHGPQAPPGHPLGRSRALADPNLAFLPDGTVLLSGLAFNFAGSPAGIFGQGFRIFVARSTDGGATFPDLVVVEEDEGLASISPLGHRAVALKGPDAPTMTVAPDGTVHLLWRRMIQATPAEAERSIMTASLSRDGGRTWETPKTLESGGLNAVAAQTIATRDGLLLAAVGAWGDGGVTDTRKNTHQMLARSTDGGATWTLLPLAEEFVEDVAWLPTVADSAEGILFAYPVADEAGRESVALRVSTDRGLTFGPPTLIVTNPARGHAVPTLGGDGVRAFLTFFAPQEDGATRNHLYVVALGNGSATAPVLLDGTLTEDAIVLGEYFGLAVTEGRAFPVWTNNEQGGRLFGASLRLGAVPTP